MTKDLRNSANANNPGHRIFIRKELKFDVGFPRSKKKDIEFSSVQKPSD
jgi:hypothetical protein